MKKTLLFLFTGLVSLGLGISQPSRAAAVIAPPRAQVSAGLDDRTLVLYPNPSTGIVHLTINGLEGRHAELSVLNVIGTLLYRETLTELNERYSKTLDLTHFASGLYYVKLEANNSSQLCKLVIR